MAFFSTNSMEKKFHNSTRGGAKKEPKEGRSTLSKQSRTLLKAATWPWCRRPKRPRLRRVGVASFADKQKLQSKNARGFFESFDKNIKGDSIMILPQVHLRKPCYDFYFL